MNFFERFTKTSMWPAYAGFLMALYYAVFVRFYESANFTLDKDPEGFNIASYIAGVVIMICGFILLALVKPWTKVVPANIPVIGGKKIPRLIILIPTLVCTAFLLAHAMSGIITKALYLCGAITIYFPYLKGDLRNMALWDLLFYEPWFLIMGILAGLTSAHYAQATGSSPRTFRRGTVIFLVMVVILTTLFVLAISRNSAHFDEGLFGQFNFFS